MKRDDDTISAAMRAMQQQRDFQRALQPLSNTGLILDVLRSDPVRQALTASSSIKGLQDTAAKLAAASGTNALSEQMKSVLALSKQPGLSANMMAHLKPEGTLASIKAASDLGIGSQISALLAAKGVADTPTFATGGAVAEALKSIKAMSIGDGILAGLLRDRSQNSMTRQIQSALGATSALLSLTSIAPGIGTDTLTRATQWSAERIVAGSTIADIMRANGLGERQRKAMMDGATLTASASWRTMMDGAMGTSLAGLRPSVVSTYAGLHRSALPIVARASDFGLQHVGSELAGHLAVHLGQLQREMSAMLVPLESLLTDSRGPDASTPDVIPDHELVAVAVEFEQAMTEVASTGTLDALLHFLDRALAAFARNTAREFGGMGVITVLPLMVAIAQIIFWLEPAWTPVPEATQPPGIERVQQEQLALSGKLDALTKTLARQEADNLEGIPRSRIKRPAVVRAGPGRECPGVWRLEAGEVVGARDREGGWVLVFYRDSLSGTLGSGWVYSANLEKPDE